jgi:hypothetical protein
MTLTSIRVDTDRLLRPRPEDPDRDEPRPLPPADRRPFAGWTRTYREASGTPDPAKALLEIGREMYRWLDGNEGWLARLRAGSGTAPIVLEVAASVEPTEAERAFLEAPWELLADERGHLAQRTPLFVPVRRLGKRAEPVASSAYRLSMVFMAAAPEGGGAALSYEEEETAILRAVGSLGMDVVVEEMGTLEDLAETMAREKPVDVLHVSCHGNNKPEPVLGLETETGGLARTTPLEAFTSRSMGPTNTQRSRRHWRC